VAKFGPPEKEVYARWGLHHLQNVNQHKFDPTLLNFPAMVDMKGILREQTQVSQSQNQKRKKYQSFKSKSDKNGYRGRGSQRENSWEGE